MSKMPKLMLITGNYMIRGTRTKLLKLKFQVQVVKRTLYKSFIPLECMASQLYLRYFHLSILFLILEMVLEVCDFGTYMTRK